MAKAGGDERLVLAAAGAEREIGLFRGGDEFRAGGDGEFRDDEELGGEVAVVEFLQQMRIALRDGEFDRSLVVAGEFLRLDPRLDGRLMTALI